MGVYTKNNDIALNSESFIECTMEPGIQAALNIVSESEMNYNAIMQAVGVHELAVFESTGADMIYEASDIRGFVEKVKEFFRNLWEKIKGLFRKFFALLDSYAKNDKDFINKYKKHLLTVSTSNFEYKGFKFSNLEHNLDKAGSSMESVFVNEIKDGLDADAKSEIVEKMRGKSIGEGGALEASEFTKELFKFFRSGEDSKETLDNISVVTEIQNIDGNSQLKKKAEKAYSELEKKIKDAIKNLVKQADAKIKLVPKDEKSEGAASDVKYISDLAYFMKEEMNILQLVNGALLTAIKDQNRQSKAICVALMNYKPKNESYSFEDSVNESFLSGVKLR